MFLLQGPGFQVNCVTVRATGKLSIQIFDFHISEFKLSTESAKYLSFTFSGEMHVLQKQRKEMGCDSHPSAHLSTSVLHADNRVCRGAPGDTQASLGEGREPLHLAQ